MHLGFLLLGLRVSFLYSPENGEDWQLGYIISEIGPKHYRSPNLRLGEFFFNRLIAGYHSPNSVRGHDTRELSRIFRLFWIPKRIAAEIKLPQKILAKIFPPKTIPKSKISNPQNPSIIPVAWNPEIADIGLVLHFNMSAKEETIEAVSFGALEEAVDFIK